MMILGIDVAKAKVDIALLDGQELIATGQFNNTPAGFKKLSKWLKHKTGEPVRACMEATGRYGDELAEYLHKQGQEICRKPITSQ